MPHFCRRQGLLYPVNDVVQELDVPSRYLQGARSLRNELFTGWASEAGRLFHWGGDGELRTLGRGYPPDFDLAALELFHARSGVALLLQVLFCFFEEELTPICLGVLGLLRFRELDRLVCLARFNFSSTQLQLRRSICEVNEILWGEPVRCEAELRQNFFCGL